MNQSMFVGLIYNAALLLALGIIFDSITLRNYRNNWLSKVVIGLCLGAVTLGIMVNPWVLQPGVVFDSRSILLSITAMFFGIIPTAIATALALAYRIYQGGAGVYMGCSVIIFSVIWGFIWKKNHFRWKKPYSWREFYLLGIANHITMLALTVLLPLSIRAEVFTAIALPVIMVYPVGTVLLGQVIARRMRRRLARQRMQESEDKYRVLAETAQDMIITLMFNGSVTYLNRKAKEFLGIQALDLEKINIWDFVVPEYHALLKQNLAARLAGNKEAKLFQMDIYNIHKRTITVEVSSSPITSNGTVNGVIAIIRDITDRIAGQLEIQASETKYRTLVETANEGIFVMDKDFISTFVNQRIIEMVGYSEAEILGKHVSTFMPAEDLPDHDSKMSERMRGESSHYERKFNRKDGTTLWAMLSAKALLDEEGRFAGSVVMLTDITAIKEAEQALQESEAKYRTIFDLTLEGIYQTTPEGKYINVNPAFAQIVGYKSPQELTTAISDIGKQLYVDPLRREELKQRLATDFIVREFETQLYRKDGSIVWVSINATVICDVKGKVQYYQGGMIDINSRKLAEMALKDSQARFEQFLDQIPGSAFIKDKNSRCLFVNRHMMQNLGAIDWIGKNPEEIFPPEVAQEFIEDDRITLEMGVKHAFDSVENAEGAIRHFETTKFVIEQPDGDKLIGGISLNVTETVEAHNEIRRYSSRLELLHEIDSIILENLAFDTVSQSVLEHLHKMIPCAIITLNEFIDGNCKVCSMYSESDKYPYIQIGQVYPFSFDTIREIKAQKMLIIENAGEKDMDDRLPIRTRLIQEGMHYFVYIALMGQDDILGFLGFISETSHILSEANKVILIEIAKHFSIVMQQLKLIGDIKRHNEDLESKVEERTGQLRDANKELETFSYTVAHDLRSPLRSIDGFSNILLEDYSASLEPEAIKLLDVIINNTRKMDTLIKELLNLAKLNPYTMKLRNLNMNELILDVLQDALTPDLEGLFEVQIATLPDIRADSTLIRQVWQNLITNAIKFTLPQAEKKLTIGSYRRDGGIVYFVQDTGVGFNMKYVDKVFGPFQRLHREGEFEGIGIGLAFVKKIIQRHNGEVWAESELGKGSTFYFYLP